MSRDLDRQVAQALGYAVCTGVSTYDGSDLPYEVWITDPARADDPVFKRQDVTLNPVPYSTDIAAAWTLVEYMLARDGVDFYIEYYPSGSARWWARFDDTTQVHLNRYGSENKRLGDANGETAAEAIARALVAAMGGQTNET